MSDTPVIEVERLNLTYGDFHAVKDLSFEVRRGELYALLGTNGAGKISTLETIEGHRRPTSGTVRVFGHSPQDRRAVRPRVGIMLQESGFSPDLTVRESVGLIGRLTRRTDDVDRLLDLVDMRLRRYYRLTDAGAARLRDEVAQVRANASLAATRLRRRSALGLNLAVVR